MKKEQILLQMGFKRVDFSDNSSYWWEKKIDKESILIADVEWNHYYLDHKQYDLVWGKWKHIGWTTIKYFNTFNKMIKWLNENQKINKN